MDTLCEPVCSNSFKSEDLSTASGVLKGEMKLLDSLVVRVAEKPACPQATLWLWTDTPFRRK